MLIDELTRDANYGADPISSKIYNPKNATKNVPVVTLSKENEIKLLEKSAFKRTIKWNKYRSKMPVQSNNSN